MTGVKALVTARAGIGLIHFTPTHTSCVYFHPCTQYHCTLAPNTLYPVHRTQYTVQNTQYKVDNTQYKVQSTQYKVHITQYKVHSTVHSTQFTLHIKHYTLHYTLYTSIIVSSTQNTKHSTIHTSTLVFSTQYTGYITQKYPVSSTQWQQHFNNDWKPLGTITV